MTEPTPRRAATDEPRLVSRSVLTHSIVLLNLGSGTHTITVQAQFVPSIKTRTATLPVAAAVQAGTARYAAAAQT